jgi:uncharacterized protein (TIGR00730 family)
MNLFSAPHRAQFFRDVGIFFRISFEFWRGFHFLRTTRRAVTIFGSARLPEQHPDCQDAAKLAAYFAKAGITVITGGGPGIMQAANRGAFQANGDSVGINIEIPREQHINPFVHRGLKSRYFFVRKVLLCRYSEAFIAYPGGFGTLDEFFELITLIQTGKMIERPVILVGRKFWAGLIEWCRTTLIPAGMISSDELNRIQLVDHADEAKEKLASIFNRT